MPNLHRRTKAASGDALGEHLNCDTREIPDGVIPKVLLKTKGGFYRCINTEPHALSYIWYMTDIKLCSVEELEKEMMVPGRRWFATDKFTYQLQLKTGASTTEGEPWICLINIKHKDFYWVGKRHVDAKKAPVTLVITLEEVYLKSAFHQTRLYRLIIKQCQRILENELICRNGRSMIEVRKVVPTEEQLDQLMICPGIGRIYEGAYDDRSGDPRRKLLREGCGGMPTAPENKALVMLSGGIDSPVAAYRMMTRGCNVRGVHYLNSSNDTAAIIAKNRIICETLSRIQGHFDMHYVNIHKLQTQILAAVPNHNRTLVYKWCMLTLSASFDDSYLIITGDSAAQVASQTIPNLSVLYASVNKAIVAPLIGSTKSEIIKEARKIKTFDASILPGADCCQYLTCKVGANLNMSLRTLKACVKKISFCDLPVTKEVFRNGKLVETVQLSFNPNLGFSSMLRTEDNGALDMKAVEEEDDENDRINFDAAAGTMMTAAVKRAMLIAPEGNPNSMHSSGRAARAAVEKVRAELALHLGVSAKDIIFTSGGTESNNLALHGYRVEREAWTHPSTQGQGKDQIPANAPVCQVVDVVNHETGSIIRDFKRPKNGRLHLDACQALTKIDFSSLPLSEVDSIAVSAHKINGPVGIGALYIRGLSCQPFFTGGLQEHGIRPGTENVLGICGFGEALRIDRSASVHREVEALLVEELTALGFRINRRGETSGFIVHATLPEGYNNTQFVSLLSSEYKVDIGTGSACKTGVANTSVYDTLKIPAEPDRSLRFSWDCFAQISDAERVIEAVKKALKQLKHR